MLSNFRKIYRRPPFYKNVLIMVVPMILQNLITNLVSLIDNIMVGQIGTEQMNGVSIVNQFIFVFNITVFGAVASRNLRSTVLRKRRQRRTEVHFPLPNHNRYTDYCPRLSYFLSSG